MHSIGSIALGAALLASTASAQFWRMTHNPLVRTRLDPIVSPGKVAGHVHAFAGSSAITLTMDAAKVADGACTTNGMSADKSGYWTPQLYYKHRNGTYSAIQSDSFIIYWLYRGFDKGEEFGEIPPNFRIVAGNTTRDYHDDSIPHHQAVKFPCFGFPADQDHLKGDLNSLPTDRHCPLLRPQIGFPNCWNGVDAYKEDNSHVAYGEGNGEYGPCPAGWKRIPTLFIEHLYRLEEIDWYPGSLVFSNGDNHGYTFHADWLNGFPAGMMKDTFEQCRDMGGEFRDCKVMSTFEQPEGKCRIQQQDDAMMVDEPIGADFPLAQLPGNNPEFNSSREGNMPKVPRSSYIEQAGFVRATEEFGGVCNGSKCTDYMGPSGSKDGGSVAPAPAPVSSVSASSSGPAESSTWASASASSTAAQSRSTTASDTAVETESRMQVATTMPTPSASATPTETQDDMAQPKPTTIGQNLVADKPASNNGGSAAGNADGKAPPTGELGSGEEELVCYRRKKKNARRSRGIVGAADRW